jgi:hypothetical protein
MDDKKLLIVDDETDLMQKALPVKTTMRESSLKLKPHEMWPDGKVRPHRIRTKSGEIVALTDDEFASLVLVARHQANANPQGKSARQKPDLVPGEHLALWSDSHEHAVVVKVKADGRVIVSHSRFAEGPMHYCRFLIKHKMYDVLRCSGGTATIRLSEIHHAQG